MDFLVNGSSVISGTASSESWEISKFRHFAASPVAPVEESVLHSKEISHRINHSALISPLICIQDKIRSSPISSPFTSPEKISFVSVPVGITRFDPQSFFPPICPEKTVFSKRIIHPFA